MKTVSIGFAIPLGAVQDTAKDHWKFRICRIIKVIEAAPCSKTLYEILCSDENILQYGVTKVSNMQLCIYECNLVGGY